MPDSSFGVSLMRISSSNYLLLYLELFVPKSLVPRKIYIISLNFHIENVTSGNSCLKNVKNQRKDYSSLYLNICSFILKLYTFIYIVIISVIDEHTGYT